MSFILDALKKSESDRQRQSGPSLFEVKVAPPRRTLPVWAVAIAVLLGINIVVVSWMLLRRPAAQSRAPTASATSAPSVAPAGPAAAQDSAAARAAATAREPGSSAARPTDGGAPGPGPAAAAAPPSAAAPAAAPAMSSSHSSAAPLARGDNQSGGQQGADDNPADHAPAVEPDATPGPGSSGSTGQDLPLYQQIVISAGLPDLHLDLHVYADRPQDRFVMINMHRLGEGDALPSGVQVETIRPDGVVMIYHGTRFLLPRN